MPSDNYCGNYIRFGIPSLDELICGSKQAYGFQIAGKKEQVQSEGDDKPLEVVNPAAMAQAETSSVCLIGPDGTGKSVLAMHMAAHYAADMYSHDKNSVSPFIFYVSTDLQHDKAYRVWENFGLRTPYRRRLRFLSFPQDTQFERRYETCKDLEIDFGTPYAPLDKHGSNERPLADYLYNRDKGQNRVEVAFVNLASETAGDDWSYLNRVIALLDKPGVGMPRHLLVLDAVEGLETLVGNYDAFGEQRTRRSRVAQLIRTAQEKCHIMLVIEESKDNERLPEEFVTDLVIRLRSNSMEKEGSHYVRRTVEVDKARAQKNVRGQHAFVIRTGEGSFTLDHNNPDDPVTNIDSPLGLSDPYDEPDRGREFGYIHVMHSLHYQHRALMEAHPADGYVTKSVKVKEPVSPARNPEHPVLIPASVETQNASITVRDGAVSSTQVSDTLSDGSLDPKEKDIELQITNAQQENNVRGYAGFGLPHLDDMLSGRTSIDVVKETNSHTNVLSDPQGLPFGSVTALIGETGTHKNRLATAFLSQCFAGNRNRQIAIMLTTVDVNDEELLRKFNKHLGLNGSEPLAPALKQRIICRRLEKHDLSSATLFHIVRSVVREAKLRLNSEDGMKAQIGVRENEKDIYRRRGHGSEIRLVISNLDAMRSTYPDVEKDPLFLPALIYFLRREGVTSLIVHTEEGGPNNTQRRGFTRNLIGEVDHHLFTWHVPFYGEDRIAIAAIPPVLDDHPAVIRELRSMELPDGKKCSDRLEVDPAFEIYSGLMEKSTPRLVPLEVRLWGDSKTFRDYITDLDAMFREHFVSLVGEQRIVSEVPKQKYDGLMSFSYLQGNSNLDHTVIIQVDEFWTSEKFALLRQEWYLAAETVRKDFKANPMCHTMVRQIPVRGIM